jgi:NAD(P)-dependent dehydrogenase (short-subunit alcohol dehydrogenase family)
VNRRNAERGQGLARSLGERARFHAADITDPDAADAVVDACIASFGALDAAVNNAALDHTDELLATPMASVRRVFEVNTFGTIAMLQAAARSMSERGGSIVNITSRRSMSHPKGCARTHSVGSRRAGAPGDPGERRRTGDDQNTALRSLVGGRARFRAGRA